MADTVTGCRCEPAAFFRFSVLSVKYPDWKIIRFYGKIKRFIFAESLTATSERTERK